MLVRLNPNRLVQFGFEPLDVLSAIGTVHQGTEVAQTYDGNQIFGVSVILDPADRFDPETLGGLLLQNEQGNLVPLRELASVSLGSGRYSILHDGAWRVQIVTSNVRGRAPDSFVTEAQQKIGAIELPAGTYIGFSGTAEGAGGRAQADSPQFDYRRGPDFRPAVLRLRKSVLRARMIATLRASLRSAA